MADNYMVQRIRDLKTCGYSNSDIRAILRSENLKAPCDRTLKKYFAGEEAGDTDASGPGRHSVWDRSPFRETILKVLSIHTSKKIYTSSIYDLMTEIYVDTEQYDRLPGSLRSLQRYTAYLRNNRLVDGYEKKGRIYDHVFDTPPGDQMLIDFGQYRLTDNTSFHFICLLLRYSRFLVVIGQDHKYNSAEACEAIYSAFRGLGGRVRYLVIDQDAVFIDTELYGEVIKTRVFEDFCQEQDLRLFVCRKADPESKGAIEKSVAFVKSRYLSARIDRSAKELSNGLPGWLQRVNSRVHRTTYCIPKDVFEETEQPALRPILPSYYDNTGVSFVDVQLENYPYITYRSNKYYFPSSFAFRKVSYKITADNIYLCDRYHKVITSYPISPLKGRSFQQEGFQMKSTAWRTTVDDMRKKWDCYDFQHFVNGVRKENPRYLNEQFHMIASYLDNREPSREFVANLMAYCCKNYRYKYSQFKASYEVLEAHPGISPQTAGNVPAVESRDLEFYQDVFDAMAKEGTAHVE